MDAPQLPARPLQAHIANQQRLQQQQHPTTSTPITPMRINNNSQSSNNAWATRPVAFGVAALLLLTSVLGIYMSTSYIGEIHMIRQLFGSSSGGSSSGTDNKTLTGAVDAAYAWGLTYLYLAIAVCVCQIVACAVGVFAIFKQHLGQYKVYMFGSGGLLVVRIVLMVLLRGWWYLSVSVVVQGAAVYPMWVYWREWEERSKYGLSMK